MLTLLCPQVGDAGLYTCLAQSPAGEVEKSFRVRVQGRGCQGGGRRRRQDGTYRGRSASHALSAAHLGPPHVIGPQGPRSVVGLAPGQLVLECSVEAEPAPEIEWHRDGILLQVGARLGTRGRHLLCRSGPRPCRLDLGAEGLPRGQHFASPLSWCPVLLLLLSSRFMDGDTEARLGFTAWLLMHICVLPIIPSSYTWWLGDPGLVTEVLCACPHTHTKWGPRIVGLLEAPAPD